MNGVAQQKVVNKFDFCDIIWYIIRERGNLLNGRSVLQSRKLHAGISRNNRLSVHWQFVTRRLIPAFIIMGRISKTWHLFDFFEPYQLPGLYAVSYTHHRAHET